jgi:nitrite reductase/ring-hydroxylating ferredoxin subunit
MDWIDVMSLAELDDRPKRVVRVDGRQILILRSGERVFACTNRCPHEGYPLSEGELCENATLRCHWHNWTFDLRSQETLVGADALPQFPVKIEAGRVMLGAVAPDRADVRRRAIDGITRALDDADQARLLRETARLMLADGDPLDAIRAALDWVAPRLQYGTTHAIGGAPDWLELAATPALGADERLAALGEILGHIADDGRRERRFLFAAEVDSWNEAAFLAALENADEVRAIALVRGALVQGLSATDLLPSLATAALAHYMDFGHSLIYTVKTVELIERLGEGVAEPLLCLLVRSLCYATREDLLPEFRAYRSALARWSSPSDVSHDGHPPLMVRVSPTLAIETVLAWSASYEPTQIFRALVDSAAHVLLHVNEAALTTTRGTIAKNATWLNHTHAITFADAALRVTPRVPALWPAVLLQLACFIGQSAPSIDLAQTTDVWWSDDPPALLATLRASLVDHGRDRYIISVHLIKTLFAAMRLIASGDASPALMSAALNRFFHAPMKGRHVLRTARQMLAVAAEG